MTTVKIKVGSNWENIALATYPVGSVYISYVNTSPATLFGGTWSQITTGVLRMANDTNTGGSDTFTIASKNLPTHTHSVGAHSHGLNSHTHSIPEHGHGFTQPTVSGGATTTGGGGSHGHWVNAYDSTTEFFFKSSNEANNYGLISGGGFGGRPVVQTASKNHSSRLYATGVGDHTHSVPAHSHSVSGGAVSNKTAFTSGQASGSTANSTAFESGNGGFANEAISNLPAYQNLYAWRRTA